MSQLKERRAVYMREYQKRPEAKARAKARYDRNPEKHRAKAKAWYHANKERANARLLIWKAANPEKVAAYKAKVKETRWHRANHVKKNYGISLIENDRLFDKYDGKCHLCQERKSRFIDHCHNTGRVRGALCYQCNMGLGLFGDEPDLLVKAIEYLVQGEVN